MTLNQITTDIQKCSDVKLYRSAQLYVYFIRKHNEELVRSSGLLKYIPEAVPNLNSYDNMCTHDAQEYYLLFEQTQLISTRHNTGAIAVIYIMV